MKVESSALGYFCGKSVMAPVAGEWQIFPGPWPEGEEETRALERFRETAQRENELLKELELDPEVIRHQNKEIFKKKTEDKGFLLEDLSEFYSLLVVMDGVRQLKFVIHWVLESSPEGIVLSPYIESRRDLPPEVSRLLSWRERRDLGSKSQALKLLVFTGLVALKE